MSITLFLALAGNIAAVLLVLWLLVSRWTARDERDAARQVLRDAKDENDGLEETIAAYRSINGQMLTQLTEYRDREAKQLAPLVKANAVRAANAKSRVNAH